MARNLQLAIEQWSRSADGGPGGDFVICFQTPTTLRMIIGDVCGHGREAAAVAERVRRRLERDVRRPLSAVRFRRWNRELKRELLGGFVSLTAVEIDRASGAARIANAGNPAVLVQRADGRQETFANTGMVLGILDRIDWVEPSISHLRLGPDDRVICFTDGLTERLSSEREIFGLERVKRAIALVAGSPVRALRRWVAAFEGPGAEQDDLTILCVTQKRDAA
jgi:serine phosphatase RsbU (regulator of sigma subunit)